MVSDTSQRGLERERGKHTHSGRWGGAQNWDGQGKSKQESLPETVFTGMKTK